MATALERQLKRLGLFGLARLASTPGHSPSEEDLASVRRVLVVRPDERIGNAILIIPLLNAIKSRFPACHLTLVMARRYWDLCEFIPSVDEFVPFDKRHYARNPVAFIAFIRRLRKLQYDLVFDAAGDHSISFTHLAITAYSGGRFRVGHDRGGAGKLYEVAVPVSTSDRHETERHLDLLRAVTSVSADPRPLLKPGGSSEFADRLWERLQWRSEKSTVIIHPGARGRKRWPAAKFAEVADALAAAGLQVGVVWGPSDTAAASEMLSMSGPNVRSIGILALRDFVSVVRKATVFFSSDCGPMHLAAAAPPKRGVVVVFTIDKGRRYHPLGAFDKVFVEGVHAVNAGNVSFFITLLASESAEALRNEQFVGFGS